MKWGVRKSKQEARKDAKEHIRAKDNHHKLIKAKANSIKKTNSIHKHDGAPTAYYVANKRKIDSYIIGKAQ